MSEFGALWKQWNSPAWSAVSLLEGGELRCIKANKNNVVIIIIITACLLQCTVRVTGCSGRRRGRWPTSSSWHDLSFSGVFIRTPPSTSGGIDPLLSRLSTGGVLFCCHQLFLFFSCFIFPSSVCFLFVCDLTTSMWSFLLFCCCFGGSLFLCLLFCLFGVVVVAVFILHTLALLREFALATALSFQVLCWS